MGEILGTVFSAIFSGGMTGIIGVVVQRIADYKNKQLDIEINRVKFEHEVQMREMDSKILAQEWAARTEVAQIEADGKEAVADAQAFSASFNEPLRYSDRVSPSNGQGWMLVVLDFIRGLVRPGLTIYLCILTTLVYVQAQSLAKNELAPEDAFEIMKMVIGTVLYLTTTCVLWWFGTRNKQPAPKIR